MFAWKSPSAYSRARMGVTLLILGHSSNATSYYLVSSLCRSRFLDARSMCRLSSLVRRFKDRTPGSSVHSSRPSLEAVKGQVKVDIREAPKNYRDAKDRVSKQANFTPHCISLLTFHRLTFEITGDVLQRVSSTLTSQRIHRRNSQSTQSVLTSFQRLRSLV